MDTISCCCESFLSVVSKGVESWIVLVWNGAGMCTGAICEEELGRGQKDEDEAEGVLLCLGTGLGCCSLDVDLLSGMWSSRQESCGETGEGRGHVVCGSETDNVFSTPVERGAGSKGGLVRSGGRYAGGVPRGEEGGFEVAFFRDGTVKEVMLIGSDASMDGVEGDIGGRDPLVSSILALCFFLYRVGCQYEGRQISEVMKKKKKKIKDIW